METSALRLPVPDLRAARRHAILFVLSASATFTLGSALVKALTADFPVLEIVMFRSIVGFAAMLPMIICAGGLNALKTRRPIGHALRTIYGFIGTVTSVYGFGVLPLVTVTALGFAMPLFLTVVSVPLLGERVGPRRATAVVVGFVGVMVMLRPWHVDAVSLPLSAVAIVLAGVFT
jgi:drug/metabolite transporter (DMT)-like permease